ncbi:unnamed protein product [Rhizoctonia solani]|uniref:PAS domain-containing protein n=1 Tax=Rhizoctonia solani TaxID=456999 RepID=A0A8H3DUF5_9AGAM|nr:unnamed protein product [Rhizoctonia solani]
MESFIFMCRPGTLQFVYVSGSTDALGFHESHILPLTMLKLLPDEEQEPVRDALSAVVRENKTAIVIYARLLHATRRRFVPCQITVSFANNVIVGGICEASFDIIGETARDRTAEEVIVVSTEHTDHPGMVGYPAYNWTGTQFARTILLLQRFSSECTITNCSNNAILDNETCIGQSIFRYAAPQDEDSVRSFVGDLRRSKPEADSPANIGFTYHTFSLRPAGGNQQGPNQAMFPGASEFRVSAVGFTTSDGIVLVLKRES